MHRDLQLEGYVRIRDVPPGRLTAAQQVRVRRATVADAPEVGPAIHDLMRSLPYPRYYFDFETINFAAPIWAGSRPWEQAPFQYSCHIENADGSLEHREFLDLSGRPPMRECAERLLADLGHEGPVLVYHAAFERGVLNSLATRFPDLSAGLSAVVTRIVDLKPIVKDHYYHPAMRGSWSIKAVLPTVAPDLDYDDLGQLHDGTEAQIAYDEAIAPGTSAERREELRRGLLEYCERDTLGMVRLVHCFAEGD